MDDNRLIIPDVVVVDVETTGMAPPEHRIIEIGAVRLRDGKEHRSLATLVQPRRSVPYFITSLTGITTDMLLTAPYFEEISGVLWDFMAGAVICAHNASFDLKFLRWEFSRCGPLPPLLEEDAPAICTMKLSRRLQPDLTDHRLDTIAGGMGLSFIKRHRALDDAMVTARIIANYLEMIEARGICDIKGILKFQRSRIQRPE